MDRPAMTHETQRYPGAGRGALDSTRVRGTRRSTRPKRQTPAGEEPSVSRAEPFPAVRSVVDALSRNEPESALRLGILRYLDRVGSATVREIPRTWPMTRQLVRATVARLIRDGLVCLVPSAERSGPRRARITEYGRRILDEVDWDAAIWLSEGDA